MPTAVGKGEKEGKKKKKEEKKEEETEGGGNAPISWMPTAVKKTKKKKKERRSTQLTNLIPERSVCAPSGENKAKFYLLTNPDNQQLIAGIDTFHMTFFGNVNTRINCRYFRAVSGCVKS